MLVVVDDGAVIRVAGRAVGAGTVAGGRVAEATLDTADDLDEQATASTARANAPAARFTTADSRSAQCLDPRVAIGRGIESQYMQ